MNQINLSKSTKIYFAAFASQKTKKNKVFSVGLTFWSVFSWHYFMRDRFSFSGNPVPFRITLNHEILINWAEIWYFYKEYYWEKYFPQLEKRVFIFRSLVSAMGYFGHGLFQPRVISICGSFYPESKTWQTKTNEFRGSFFFFFFFISKTQKSTVQSVIQLRTRFFLKKLKVIGFRDFFPCKFVKNYFFSIKFLHAHLQYICNIPTMHLKDTLKALGGDDFTK